MFVQTCVILTHFKVFCPLYTSAPPKVEWGYTGFTPMSVRPSVRPSVNNTSRFRYLQQFKERTCPKELVLNQKKNKEDTRATFLDLEAHIKDGRFYTKTYDKREAFNFEIVNYPDLSGNIPERSAYGIYISQVIRIYMYTISLTLERINSRPCSISIIYHST